MLFDTHYCKTCSKCYKDTDGEIKCIYNGKTLTEKRVKHTTTCSHFSAEHNGIDITTGRQYKPNKKRYQQYKLQPEESSAKKTWNWSGDNV